MFQEIKGTPKSRNKWSKEKRKTIRNLGKQRSIIKHALAVLLYSVAQWIEPGL